MNKWMALALLAAPGLVSAATVNITFTGIVDSVGESHCYVYSNGNCTLGYWSPTSLTEFQGGRAQVGDTFSGSFRYDSSAVRRDGNDGYSLYGPVFEDVQIRMGSISLPTAPLQQTGGHVFVSNDFDLNYDMFGLDQDFAGGVWQGQLSVTLLDWSATAFDGTALPTSFDLSRFGNPANASIAIRDLSNDTSVTVSGRFSTFEATVATPVPEPSTWSLLCLGVAGLLARRRFAQRRG